MHEWAHAAIAREIDGAAEALAAYCAKPGSAKRVHRARKRLARLRAALEDLGPLAGADPAFLERVNALHRRAGKVRDSDVLLERIEAYCKTPAGGERAELQQMRTALRKRRKRARRKLQRAVRRYPELRR